MFYRVYSRQQAAANVTPKLSADIQSLRDIITLSSRSSSMIYSQAFRDERFSPAVALFSAAGLIHTTAGINQSGRKRSKSERKKFIFIFPISCLIFNIKPFSTFQIFLPIAKSTGDRKLF